MILMLTRAVSRERTRTTGISRASTLLQVASPVATYVGVLAGGCAVIATVSPGLAVVIAAGGLAVAAIVVIPGWASSLRPGRRLAAAESAARQGLVDALDGGPFPAGRRAG
jgi:hypothetical protein